MFKYIPPAVKPRTVFPADPESVTTFDMLAMARIEARWRTENEIPNFLIAYCETDDTYWVVPDWEARINLQGTFVLVSTTKDEIEMEIKEYV